MRCLEYALLAAALLTLITATPPLAADGHSTPLSPSPSKSIRPQTRCPVMGGPIDKALYVDIKGKRVYLCCAACEAAVRAEPDKYLKKIERRGESVAETPANE